MELKKELNSTPLPQRNQNAANGSVAQNTPAKTQPTPQQPKNQNATNAQTNANNVDKKPFLNQKMGNMANAGNMKRNPRFANNRNGRGGRRDPNFENRGNDRRSQSQQNSIQSNAPQNNSMENNDDSGNMKSINQHNQNNQNDNRRFGNDSSDGMRRFGHRDGRKGEDFMIQQKLKHIQGPTHELPPVEHTEIKFSGRNRLYVGNLPQDVKEEDLREWFKPYGEINEAFVNNEKNFAFLKVDYHINAERAKRELDGSTHKNRQIRIRFAPNATTIRVKNLTPFVTNELLHKAFEIFGPIERAAIVVDDRGKPTGEGIVEYTRKSGAMIALRYCTEKCYFLTSSLRPCVVELFEHSDDTDGFPEKAVNRKTDAYMNARQFGPRFAEANSFEHEYGRDEENFPKKSVWAS